MMTYPVRFLLALISSEFCSINAEFELLMERPSLVPGEVHEAAGKASEGCEKGQDLEPYLVLTLSRWWLKSWE